MHNLIYLVEIEKDEDGYFAKAIDLENCYTQGDSFEEVLENIKEAISCHLESLKKDNLPIPEPITKSIQPNKEHIFTAVAV